MRAQCIPIALALTLSACPVEHAANDSASPVRRDAGDVDAAVVDAVTADLTGVDLSTPDGAGADTASADTAASDVQATDSVPPADAGSQDTSAADSAGIDSASATCSSDDSHEPNDVVGEAKPLDLAQAYELTGCDDDWFSFTLPASKALVVDALFSDALADLDLKLYRADNITSSLDTSMTTSDNEQVVLPPQDQATPLLLLVDHFAGGSAPYTLEFTLSDPPANDTCETAAAVTVPVNGDQVSVSGNTAAAGDHRVSTIDCQTVLQGDATRDLFYRFTADAGMTGHVFAQLVTPGGWYGVLYVFEDSCAASADLLCTGTTAAIAVQPGHTYYLVVDGDMEGDFGGFDLNLWYRPIPANDTCQGAQELTLPINGSSVSVTGHTGEGTNTFQSASSSNSYCRETVSYAPELFYSFTAASTGTVHVELYADWEASVVVQDAGCAAGATEHLCWGRYSSSMDYLWDRLDVQQGHSYTVVVDGYGDVCCSESQGSFSLSLNYVQDPPALQGGETCLDAVALPGTAGTRRANTSGTANDIDPGAVGCSGGGSGGDLFYKLSVPAGHDVMLRAEHTVQYFPLLLYVLDGDCPVRGDSCLDDGQGHDLLALIDDAPEGELRWTNTASATASYFVVIDATNGGYGEDVDLSWIVSP